MTDCFAKIRFSNPSPESLPIPKIDSEPTTISETDPQNPGNTTAKKIIEERKNKEDEPGIGWFVVGLLLLSVLFVFIVFNFYASIFSIILSILAALLAILAGMAEIRVKRNDEVIAGIKDNKPKTAKSMSHDPWVVAWRRNALWLKYLSLLAVLVVALAALIKQEPEYEKNRKPIVRLFFNSQQKYVGVFDENKQCTRLPIEDLNGIYQYSEQIREQTKRLSAD